MFVFLSRERGGVAGRHRQGGARGRKHVQILEMGGQAPDHPVHPAIPETRYLKAYFCRVNEGLK
jgi:23S rRNA G2069 N7-methylase RlmK/C1962 C5-methylase RlmI